MNLSQRDKAKFLEIANQLGANPSDLYAMINFESRWNPNAKNPLGSARGLIQFIDSTARGLGFDSSLDLVQKNPTINDQLTQVYRYLKPYSPFPSPQSLFMAVFYPRARTWSLNTPFPQHVQDVNPGIKTVGDYVNKVYGVRNAVVSYTTNRPLWFDFLIIWGVTYAGYRFYKSKKKGKK